MCESLHDKKFSGLSIPDKIESEKQQEEQSGDLQPGINLLQEKSNLIYCSSSLWFHVVSNPTKYDEIII